MDNFGSQRRLTFDSRPATLDLDTHMIQFAVVREDPEIERIIMLGRQVERVLLVASGGCTALSLQASWPSVEFTLADPNPEQLALVRRKVEALAGGITPECLRRFNVGTDDPAGLSQCGNFERLFRGLRTFLHEFVATPDEIAAWFEEGTPRDAFANPYWRVAFELYFHDTLLEAMFGPAATQHAVSGSYSAYFRRRLEAGLTDPGAASNYFLHHIFLGEYRSDALPEFLIRPAGSHRFGWFEGPIDHAPDLGSYDLLDLSNIMDWMSDREARRMVERIAWAMRPGSVVVWRQLNNVRDRTAWFGDEFEFDRERDARLGRGERSLFYSSVHVATKSRCVSRRNA